MHQAHDALLCIADGAVVNQDERRRVSPNNRFKSQHELEDLFADIPEALQNTIAISQRCGFMVETADPILPAFPTEKGDRQELIDQASQDLKNVLLHKYIRHRCPKMKRQASVSNILIASKWS